MDNTMKNAATEELEGQETFFENEAQEEETTVEETAESSNDPLKEAIEEQLKKIRRQNMLIGFQTACRVALEKIIVAERKPGKRTMNDYKRLIKDLKQFCETGLSRTVNADGETEPVKEESPDEETVQN
jgi:hypothetical protein